MGEQSAQARDRATLRVDGQRVALNRFAESALVGVIEGFLSALRDIPAGEVVVTIPAGTRARPMRDEPG